MVVLCVLANEKRAPLNKKMLKALISLVIMCKIMTEATLYVLSIQVLFKNLIFSLISNVVFRFKQSDQISGAVRELNAKTLQTDLKSCWRQLKLCLNLF